MSDINSVPVNDLSDPGAIPDFLDRTRRTPATPSGLGCVAQPSDLIEVGQEAWARLQTHQTWADWRKVGAAVAELRTRAMRSAKTNQPQGSRYSKEFSALLRIRGFDDLKKATRARLLQCMENISAIEGWRSGLETDKRLKLNHPT